MAEREANVVETFKEALPTERIDYERPKEACRIPNGACPEINLQGV